MNDFKKISKNLNITNSKFSYLIIIEKLKEYIDMVHETNAEIKIPTENTIAEYFGVSRVTVRRALKELIEEGAIYSIRGSGNYVQKQIKNNSNLNLGIIASNFYHVHPASQDFFNGIKKILNMFDINLHIYNKNQEDILNSSFYYELKKDNISGLMSLENDINILTCLKKNIKDLPLVSRNTNMDLYIAMDIQYNINCIREHLINKGHKKILVAIPDITETYNIQMLSSLYSNELNITIFDDNKNYIEKNFIDFFNVNKDITAIVAVDDFYAVKLLSTLKKINITCPEDISIITTGNHGLEKKHNISGVINPNEQVGKYMAKAIIGLVNNEKVYSKKIKGKFIDLGSVKQL